MGWQAHWWETLSGYNLNIVYRVSTENSADTPSCWRDYARTPEDHCAATILIARCNATSRLWQLYAATVQEDQVFVDVLPNTLARFILEGQT